MKKIIIVLCMMMTTCIIIGILTLNSINNEIINIRNRIDLYEERFIQLEVEEKEMASSLNNYKEKNEVNVSKIEKLEEMNSIKLEKQNHYLELKEVYNDRLKAFETEANNKEHYLNALYDQLKEDDDYNYDIGELEKLDEEVYVYKIGMFDRYIVWNQSNTNFKFVDLALMDEDAIFNDDKYIIEGRKATGSPLPIYDILNRDTQLEVSRLINMYMKSWMDCHYIISDQKDMLVYFSYPLEEGYTGYPTDFEELASKMTVNILDLKSNTTMIIERASGEYYFDELHEMEDGRGIIYNRVYENGETEERVFLW